MVRLLATVGLTVALIGLSMPVTATTPLATVGRSDDPWEGDAADDLWHSGGCEWLPSTRYLAVPESMRTIAVALLERNSVISISNDMGAKLLRVSGRTVREKGLTFVVFRNVIEEREATRLSVLTNSIGGWSLADQKELDDLKSIYAGPRRNAYRPYLIRALAGQLSPFSVFRMQLCRGGLRVHHISNGNMPARPTRVPLIVFLDVRPKAVFTLWAVDVPK